MKNVELEILKLSDKKRFVDEVMSGEIIVNNREKADLFQELRQRGYTPFPNKAKPAGPFDAAEEFDDELLLLENKVKFIGGVISGEIKAINKKKADLVQELRQRGFTPFPNNAKAVEGAVSGAFDAAEESDYGYLLSLAIKTMSQEKVEQFLAEADINDAHTAEKESDAAQIKKIKADHFSG